MNIVLLESIKTAPQLYKLTVLLSVIGIGLAMTGFLVAGTDGYPFWPLFFYFSALWIMWLYCAVFMPMGDRFGRLALLWVLIDLGIFSLFVANFAIDPNWTKTQGADLVILTTYLPIVFPTILIFGVIPSGIGATLSHFFGQAFSIFSSGFGDMASVYTFLTLTGALQSVIVFGAAGYFHERRKAGTLPVTSDR
jgi:hypothetical protein